MCGTTQTAVGTAGMGALVSIELKQYFGGIFQLLQQKPREKVKVVARGRGLGKQK